MRQRERDNPYVGMNTDRLLRKQKKRISNRKKFDKYFKDKNISIIKEVNNIVEFEYAERVYFFTELTCTIRPQGSKESWNYKDWQF